MTLGHSKAIHTQYVHHAAALNIVHLQMIYLGDFLGLTACTGESGTLVTWVWAKVVVMVAGIPVFAWG